MTTPKALVAGNWKMNGLKAAAQEINDLQAKINEGGAKCDVLICPPFTLISTLTNIGAQNVAIGAQDCHMNMSGAHTGDTSAEMLAELGCNEIIVGHSERRADHSETNETVNAKAVAAQSVGATAIICVGETESQRDSGETLKVVSAQIAGSVPNGATGENTVIAYEPVWAIGSGKTPTTDDVAEVHAVIRTAFGETAGDAEAERVRILYGGSVKPENASEFLALDDVDGGLIGGASLKAEDFMSIATSCP